MVSDTFEVATMPSVAASLYLRRIFLLHAWNLVIRGIPVGKTVRHDKVKDIAGMKSFDVTAVRLALFQFVRDSCCFPVLF